MPMNKVLVCVALSAVFLGSAIEVSDSFAQAKEGGPQGADKKGVDKKSSSGNAVPHPAGNSARGEGLYNASCVVCHGPQAAGGIGPRLAGNPVLSNEPAFWKVVYEGRHVMPPLKGAVTEQQMADIQAWLKTLK